MTDPAGASTRTFADTATGEIVEGKCPYCVVSYEWAEAQVRECEMEMRKLRAAKTRAENKLEASQTAKRDGQAWAEVLEHYAKRFPDKAKAMRSKSIKSERATALFARLEAGATLADVLAAIDAATVWRWISYGRRVKSPHSEAQVALDLADILANDVRFDYLVQHGYEMREGANDGNGHADS